MREATRLQQCLRYPFAFICVMLVLVLLVVLYLRSDRLTRLSASESQAIARILMIDQNAKQAKGLSADVEHLEGAIAEVEARLFDRGERAVNTHFFYRFEARSNIAFIKVQQLAEVPQRLAANGPDALSHYSAIAYDVAVIGDYTELLELMGALYQADPILRISDFKLSQASEAGRDPSDLLASLRVWVLAKGDA